MKYPKLRPSEPAQGWIDAEETRDVYRNDEPPREPARCPVCSNVYLNKQWYSRNNAPLEGDETMHTHLCTGCQKIRDGYYYGEIVVTGNFIEDHYQEISHLIQNEVKRAQEKNPLSKLVSVDTEGDHVVLHTTNAKLAERIGRELHKAYDGQIDIDKSEYITRVHWKRTVE